MYKKFIKIFPYIYTFILLTSGVLIYSYLSQETLTVKEAKEEKKEESDVKPTDVTLVIEGVGSNKVFKKKLKNNDTFDDLLENLRDENLISYEKTEYTYGTEYDSINGYDLRDDEIWRVYAGGEDITFKTKGVTLNDGWIYRLVLSQR